MIDINKNKEKKKIEIDEEFFQDIINTNKVLIERLSKVEEKLNQPAQAVSLPDKSDGYIFQCVETSIFDKKPETPEDIVIHQNKINEFRKKLENLMKESRVSLVNALFLKRL